jgi:hypothetical protein
VAQLGYAHVARRILFRVELLTQFNSTANLARSLLTKIDDPTQNSELTIKIAGQITEILLKIMNIGAIKAG